MKQKPDLIYLLLAGIIFLLIIGWFIYRQIFPDKSILGLTQPKQFNHTIVFIGDSMTQYLGNFDELENKLKNYYPAKKFLLLNYGFGSTNLLSVPDRLEKESTFSGRIFQAVNDIPFDLVVIESFGHNPLSEYPLDQGLKLQEEILDKIIKIITQKHPRQSIVFMATIAPLKTRYAEGVVNLLPEMRQKWVEEREAYIKNHINYANTRQIPVINIYQSSLKKDGDGNIDLINTVDFIHPSPTGIYFISEQIANFIYENHYF